MVAQKVERHEIASYGSASTFARVLNTQEAARLLEPTVAEEERMEKKRTQLAEQLNLKAAAADHAATERHRATVSARLSFRRPIRWAASQQMSAQAAPAAHPARTSVG